jgi:hypothetical protein
LRSTGLPWTNVPVEVGPINASGSGSVLRITLNSSLINLLVDLLQQAAGQSHPAFVFGTYESAKGFASCTKSGTLVSSETARFGCRSYNSNTDVCDAWTPYDASKLTQQLTPGTYYLIKTNTDVAKFQPNPSCVFAYYGPEAPSSP